MNTKEQKEIENVCGWRTRQPERKSNYLKMRNQKGITLVALVVTVIVLLILAGVAISMITGEQGLFAQTNHAGEEFKQESAYEALKVELYSAQMEKYFEQGLTDERLDERLRTIGAEVNGNEVAIRRIYI